MFGKPSRCCVVAATLVACAAAASEATAARPDDACALLTAAQVSAALGAQVGAGTYVTPTFKKTCTWTTAANGGEIVTLKLASIDEYQSAKKTAAYGSSVTAASVGGPADDAFYLGTGELVSLYVKKGDVAFKVALYAHIPVEKRQSVEKALAQQVVARL